MLYVFVRFRIVFVRFRAFSYVFVRVRVCSGSFRAFSRRRVFESSVANTEMNFKYLKFIVIYSDMRSIVTWYLKIVRQLKKNVSASMVTYGVRELL